MEKWIRNREFHKLHHGGGGQSATHSPTTATAAAGKSVAVVVVPAVVIASCEAAAVGVVGGAWRGVVIGGGGVVWEIVATSSTEAEYVAAASGCAQVLWMQNQLLDYGFTWVFFLASKDETGAILKTFISIIENLVDHKVKVIRCDNGTEFKNREMNQFYEMKDHLGKFDGKADKGFFVGYSLNSKAFRVFNNTTRIVEENLHIRFSKNTPNIAGSRPNWIFYIDALTKSTNYKPVVAGNQSNVNASIKACDDADIIIFSFSSDREDDDEEADMNNLDTTIQVNPTPTTRIQKDHPIDQDERGIVIRNKARLVTQGHTQEEGIDYDKVFSPVTRIEAIRLFLAYASFKDFMVYQMDVKSDFLYGKIKEDVYVCQPPGFEDPDFPDKVYKVKKTLYGLHQALRAWFSKVKNASTPMETQIYLRMKMEKK
nr:retrovirus-related Pol polyprotein from transposon TNT 1-94 [Tanacetum cinerariifolium]